MPKQLDAIAKLDGEADVDCADMADTLDVDGVEVHRAAEHDAGKDRELVGGVDPVDVGGRVGFRIAELLRLLQHRAEFPRLAGLHGLVHRRHDVVAGAVQDAVDAADAVAGEALAQRLDDGDAAGDGGLVTEVAIRLPRSVRQRRAVVGEQRLIGRYQVLAVGEGRLGERPRRALRAADQLEHDVDGGKGGELPRRRPANRARRARPRGPCLLSRAETATTSNPSGPSAVPAARRCRAAARAPHSRPCPDRRSRYAGAQAWGRASCELHAR